MTELWRVMRGEYVHSTWRHPDEAQRMADWLNAEPNGDLIYHVEAWS